MEEQNRFEGRAYPVGMSGFPFRLKGQGFFPGGDGLWRDEAQLAEESHRLAATGGIMFLGHDSGTCHSFDRLRESGFENSRTWEFIKERVDGAGLPSSLTFFTNAVMGLREEGTALDSTDWDDPPRFKAFCREFLVYQIQSLLPRLIVVMGLIPREALDSMAVGTTVVAGKFPKMCIGDHITTLCFTTHPHGDFNIGDEGKNRDASELREAWKQAQSQHPN
jgi:hypothetical protein